MFWCRQLANRDIATDRMDRRRAKQADLPLRRTELSCWQCLKVTEDYVVRHVDKELPPLRLYYKVLASWPSSRQPATYTEPLFAGEMKPLLRLQDILIHGSQMIRTRDMFTDPLAIDYYPQEVVTLPVFVMSLLPWSAMKLSSDTNDSTGRRRNLFLKSLSLELMPSSSSNRWTCIIVIVIGSIQANLKWFEGSVLISTC